MKKILKLILAVYARLTILLHKPRIIGITGSVGKSSTKDAIALVLRSKYRVGSSSGNLNSDVGLPLAILGFEKPGGFKPSFSSILEWLWIMVSGFFRIFQFNYPEILVLEMGADKPGDIEYLLSITGNLSCAVITDIGISHMEFFKTPDALAKEKLSILSGLNTKGCAVLNADNSKVIAGKHLTQAQVITFGFEPGADISATNIKFSHSGIGKPPVYAQLAAVAVGKFFHIGQSDAIQALENYEQPAGRLRLIPGVNDSLIIDDTYNASPSSTIAALEALAAYPAKRRLAAIGHMAELGELSESGHAQVGEKIAGMDLNLVFLVGEKTKPIEAELRNFKGQVLWFSTVDKAIPEIRNNLTAGDTILVKGSQSARMEKIVKAVMREPARADKLLVRQSREWQD